MFWLYFKSSFILLGYNFPVWSQACRNVRKPSRLLDQTHKHIFNFNNNSLMPGNPAVQHALLGQCSPHRPSSWLYPISKIPIREQPVWGYHFRKTLQTPGFSNTQFLCRPSMKGESRAGTLHHTDFCHIESFCTKWMLPEISWLCWSCKILVGL